jgi:HEPN domain-containing protein
LYDQTCFFCQQSAEKVLKALLEERAIAFVKTHDLGALHTLLAAGHPGLGGAEPRTGVPDAVCR